MWNSDLEHKYQIRKSYLNKKYTMMVINIQIACKNMEDAIYAGLVRLRNTCPIYSRSYQSKTVAMARHELKKLSDILLDIFTKAILDVSLYASSKALSDIGVSEHERYNPYARAYAKEFKNKDYYYIQAQINKMSKQFKNMIDEDIVLVSRKALVEDISKSKAASLVKNKIVARESNFVFVDKLGRRYNYLSYFEMLAFSILNTAEIDSYINALTSEKHDLVVISVTHPGKPTKWDGQIVSITGANENYPSLEDARVLSSIFHPRSQYRLIAYKDN